MKHFFFALGIFALSQPALSKILESRIDASARKIHFALEVTNACTRPQFELVSNYCQRRIDGPCYFTLKQTFQNKILCPSKKSVIHRVVDAPDTMLDDNMTIIVRFQDELFTLQAGAIWRR